MDKDYAFDKDYGVKDIQNDKAIEFQSELKSARRYIRRLNKVGIKANLYSKKLDGIERKVQESANEFDSKLVTEYHDGLAMMREETTESVNIGIYEKGIQDVKKVYDELKRYDVYLGSFNYCNDLKSKLNDETKITRSEIDSYVSNVLDIIRSINHSDTRNYAQEKKIVESVYHIAYLVCKAEMFLTGTSRILSYVKTDPIVSSFMEDEIEKDIESINDEHVKTIIRDININEKSTSLLDDRVIFALSMIGDSTKIKYIEDSILDIVHLMKEFEEHINENAKEEEKIRKKISSADKKRKSLKFLKQIGFFVTSIALTFSLYKGITSAEKKKHTTYTYKTDTETYALNTVEYKPQEYMERFDRNEKTFIYRYSPWEKSEEKFTREVTKYDVSGIPYDDLSKYLDIDLDYMKIEGSVLTETESDLTIDDLYDEAKLEVVRLIQNPDIYEENVGNYEGLSIFLTALASIIPCAILSFAFADYKKNRYGEYEITSPYTAFARNLKNREMGREDYQIYMAKLDATIDASKIFISSHEGYKKAFMEMYKKYKDYINNDEINDTYMKLTREK